MTVETSAPGFLRSLLRDSRLSTLATSTFPAWLWSPDGRRLLWANPVGAAMFGAPSSTAVIGRNFDADEPAAAAIARIAPTLVKGASPRLERLHGLGAGIGRALTCACSLIGLSGHSSAILVAAAEPAGPDLPLAERIRRLLAGSEGPIAGFAGDGRVLHAHGAEEYLRDASSLADLGLEALATEALASGSAVASVNGTRISIERIGAPTETVLIASFAPSDAIAGTGHGPSATKLIADTQAETLVATRATSPLGTASSRGRPLRFIWQIDDQGRFTLGSDEFIALTGPHTAAAIGRTWPELEAELHLDPEGKVAGAIATRDTWSGLMVSWPVDDSPVRLAVELSGLPEFDRDRTFRGYRGFGVCREEAHVLVLAEDRKTRPCDNGMPAEASAAGIAPEPAPGARGLPSLPGPSAETRTPALSPIERDAFRELSRKLAQRLTSAGIESYDEDPAGLVSEGWPAVGGPQAGSRSRARADWGKLLLDRLPVGVLVYRLDRLLHANPALLRWSGYDNLDELVEAGGLERLLIAPAADVAGDKCLTLKVDDGTEVRSTAGELIDIEWEGGAAHAFVTTMTKHTEQVGLEPLQAALTELKSTLDAVTDGVIAIDREGLILSANRSAEALFGYPHLAGRAFTDLFAAESAEAAENCLDALVRDGVAGPVNGGREIIGRGRQGDLIPLLVTVGRIGEYADRFCAVFRDITQWKRMQEEFKEARHHVELASSAKSDLLAKISHEVRTPLNSIIGFSEVMMEERFGPIGNERYREYLKDIHASGDQLMSLVNDLLDLAKIEAGELELAFSNVALDDLTRQCVAIMRTQASRRRVIIRTSLWSSPPRVVADAQSLRKIVLGLLSNAIRFTEAGGQVILSTAHTESGEVVMHVRNTGVGMRGGDIVTAFEPFGQLAISARRDVAGGGLSLRLTKALTEANHASFKLTSVSKEGTLVEIAFPASRVLAG